MNFCVVMMSIQVECHTVSFQNDPAHRHQNLILLLSEVARKFGIILLLFFFNGLLQHKVSELARCEPYHMQDGLRVVVVVDEYVATMWD